MGKKKRTNPHNSGEISISPEIGLTRLKNSFFWQWMFFGSVTVAYILLLRFYHEPIFLVGDNLGIILFAENGFIAPAFVHFIWIRMLSFLYAQAPQIPWYGLCLYTLQAASLSLVLTCFYRIIHSLGFFCLFALVLLFFWADMIVRLDFSGTSIMIGTSALLLFFLFHREGKLKAKNALFLGLILAVSGLIRLEGVLALAAIAAPFLGFFLLHATLQSTRFINTLWRKAILFTCLFLPGFLIYSANGAYRQYFLPESEAPYARIHSILQKFQDTPLMRENRNNQKALEAAGWTQFDLIRLEHWIFFDENIYHAQSFERFYEHAAKPVTTAMEFSRIVASFSTVLKNFSPFFLLMVAGFSLALGRNVYTLKDFFIFCMTGAAMLGIALALELFIRFPYRIGYPMLFSACLLVFFFSTARQNQKSPVSGHDKHSDAGIANTPTTLKNTPAWIHRNGWKNFSLSIAFPITLLLAILIHGNMLNIEYKRLPFYYHLNKDLTQTINTFFPGSFLVIEPSFANFHFIDPISPPVIKFTIVHLGWGTFSPLFYQALKQMGIERGSDLVHAMIARDDILIFSRVPWAQLLLNYAYERGLGIPQVEVIAEMDGIDQFGLYRLKK